MQELQPTQTSSYITAADFKDHFVVLTGRVLTEPKKSTSQDSQSLSLLKTAL
jgi:hypothetical protein